MRRCPDWHWSMRAHCTQFYARIDIRLRSRLKCHKRYSHSAPQCETGRSRSRPCWADRGCPGVTGTAPTPTRYRDRQNRNYRRRASSRSVPPPLVLRHGHGASRFSRHLQPPFLLPPLRLVEAKHLDATSNPPFRRALPHRPRRNRISPQPLFQLQRLFHSPPQTRS